MPLPQGGGALFDPDLLANVTDDEVRVLQPEDLRQSAEMVLDRTENLFAGTRTFLEDFVAGELQNAAEFLKIPSPLADVPDGSGGASGIPIEVEAALYADSLYEHVIGIQSRSDVLRSFWDWARSHAMLEAEGLGVTDWTLVVPALPKVAEEFALIESWLIGESWATSSRSSRRV